MTVRIEKPAINVREELADLRKPTGIAGEAMLRAETPQEQFNLIGAGRRNLIINGDFQVSQRGDYSSATNYVNATYYLDRWKSGASGGWTSQHKLNQTLPNGSLTNTYRITSTGGNYAAIDQYIEDYSIFSDQLVTFSFWAKTNFSGCSANFYTIATQFDVLSDIVADEQWHYYTVTKKVPSGGTAFRVEVWTGVGTSSGDYLEIAQVQLELGKVATPFEHRSYGEELALCQRYYYSPYVTEGDDTAIMQATSKDSSTIIGVVTFPVAMRTSPSIVNSNAQFRIDSSSKLVSNTAGSTVVIEAGSPTTGILKIQGWTGLSTDNNFACKYLEGVFGFKSEL